MTLPSGEFCEVKSKATIWLCFEQANIYLITPILLRNMNTYKYTNDTEAALKRIKAECRIKKCKPHFKVLVGGHSDVMAEGTMKQVEYILHHHNETIERFNNYEWVESVEGEVEVTVFKHGDVWVYLHVNTVRVAEDEEE